MKISIYVDDGHPLDWKVLDLLKKYHLQDLAVFYIAPQNSEREVMSVDEIKRLSEEVEIGGHTLTHPRLTRLSRKEQVFEVKTGKDVLERIIGRSLRSFACPRGWFNPQVKEVVKECGFQEMRTMKQGPTSLDGYDSFEIPVSIHFHKKDRVDLVRSVFEKLIEARSGGYFGITMHSWEIEEMDLWDELDKVFAGISNEKQRYEDTLSGN